MTRDEAYALLTEYNKEPFHLEHAETVEKTMMYFADKLGYGGDRDFWGIVGLYMTLTLKCIPKSTA